MTMLDQFFGELIKD